MFCAIPYRRPDSRDIPCNVFDFDAENGCFCAETEETPPSNSKRIQNVRPVHFSPQEIMKNIIFWLVTISVTVIHQLFNGGIKQYIQTTPPHSNLKQPILPATTSDPVAIQEDSRQEIPTIVPKPISSNSNPAPSATIQEDASHHEIPTQEQELAIDENSTIASDISKIWHDTESKEICVALKQEARCPHPALHGRLSGPALAILEWKERRSTTDGTVWCGGYGHNWLDAGDYFVEIIILYCTGFGVDALHRIDDVNTTAWMEEEHATQCVEDVKNHRITSKDEGRSIIHVPTSTEGRDSYRLGRWIRKHQVPPRPLFTRVQPLECFPTPKKGTPLHEYCIATTERDSSEEVKGLYEYEFQWNMTKGSEQQVVEKLRQRLRDDNIPRICAVGDSHSRYMYEYTLPLLNLTGLYDYVETVWPQPEGIIRRISKFNCDVFLVQVNQWPSGLPFTFGKYHLKVKQHVQNILKFNPKATVYLPSGDQCPIMAKACKCADWRGPTNMDGYTYVHQMIANELNTSQVKYVDTNFIINTHWDGHEDWQHLMERVRSRKTIYLSALMAGEIEWFE